MAVKKPAAHCNTPWRRYTCPSCSAQFVASITVRDDTPGKVCPNGHWTRTSHLSYFAKHGRLPMPRGKHVHAKTVNYAVLKTPRPAELTDALRAMLASHDALVAALPSSSMSRRLVEGSFGGVPTLVRELINELTEESHAPS